MEYLHLSIALPEQKFGGGYFPNIFVNILLLTDYQGHYCLKKKKRSLMKV